MVKGRDPIGMFIERHVFENHISVLWIPTHWNPDRFNELPKKWGVYHYEKDNVVGKYDKKSKARSKAKKLAKDNAPTKVIIRKKNGALQEEDEYHAKHIYGDKLV